MCMPQEMKLHGNGLKTEFPIPNAEGILCSSKNLCFNNCPWLVTKQQKSKFCHERIPHPVAQELGLQTERQDILSNHKLRIPFGQREQLVNRIKEFCKVTLLMRIS